MWRSVRDSWFDGADATLPSRFRAMALTERLLAGREHPGDWLERLRAAARRGFDHERAREETARLTRNLRRLRSPVTPSHGEIRAELAAGGLSEVTLRSIDAFAAYWDRYVAPKLEEYARVRLEGGWARDPDDASVEAWRWLRRVSPDLDARCRDLRLLGFAIGFAAPDARVARRAARGHALESHVASGLQARRWLRRGARTGVRATTRARVDHGRPRCRPRRTRGPPAGEGDDEPPGGCVGRRRRGWAP